MTPLVAALLVAEIAVALALRARARRARHAELRDWTAEREARRALDSLDADAHRAAQRASWDAPALDAIAARAACPEGALRPLERYRLVPDCGVGDPAWARSWFRPMRTARPGELVVAVEPEAREPFYLEALGVAAHPRLGLLEIDLVPYGAPGPASLRFVLHDELTDPDEAKRRADALAATGEQPPSPRPARAWRRLGFALALALGVGLAHAPLDGLARQPHDPSAKLRDWAAHAGPLLRDEIRPPSWFGNAMIVVWSPDIAFLRTAWFYVEDTGHRFGRAVDERSILGFLGACLVGAFYLVWSAINLGLAVGFAILGALVTAALLLYWLGRALLCAVLVLLLLAVPAGAALLPYLDGLTLALIVLPFGLAARRLVRLA